MYVRAQDGIGTSEALGCALVSACFKVPAKKGYLGSVHLFNPTKKKKKKKKKKTLTEINNKIV